MKTVNVQPKVMHIDSLQQITALHMMANSKKTFDSSFSRAKPKLFPSVDGVVNLIEKENHDTTLTYD